MTTPGQTPSNANHATSSTTPNATATGVGGGGGGGSDTPPFRYTAALAQQIENAWQDRWDREGTFVTPNPGQAGFDASRPKKFILDMFPYPSGAGLHVGHPLGYIATDIYARYMRMTGHNVLHAMGFDAFGLPAEQYAVQNNVHPREAVNRNVATMRQQLRRLGLGHDPTRSVSTTDEDFYRWTQWIFLQIFHSWYDPEALGGAGAARPIAQLVEQFERGERTVPGENRPWKSLPEQVKRRVIDEHRLAYLAEVPVNWCPMLGTVLANEEVTADGRSERGNYPVYKRPLKQWMMRITSYAERLLNDLELVDWPEKVKIMQRNWIGRSEGAMADFACNTRRIRVFTTRPDTMFGATYIVISPEHEMVDHLVGEKYGNVAFEKAIFPGSAEMLAAGASPRELVMTYRAFASKKTDAQRGEGKEKTGVFIGAYALNPVSGQRVPVFIADYVLSGYGTGAIMAVPAHDERDFEFAKAFKLPIRDVVYPRPVAAMAHYALHAFENETPPSDWRDELADYLGVVAGEGQHQRSHAEMLHMIRSRRDPARADGVVTAADTTSPGSIGERRGVVRSFWLETLDDLQIHDFNEFRERFVSAGFYARQGEAFSGGGLSVNSASASLKIDGLETATAKVRVAEYLEQAKLGKGTINYKLRDWLFSRQRYWGEPFPIVFDESGEAHAMPESMLPVTLPHMDNFQPESSEDPQAPVKTPLDRAKEWATTTLDIGHGPQRYKRETNTMPNWAGSCWYYLRYLDPKNASQFCSPRVEKYWMSGGLEKSAASKSGVDLYVGGVEHAVLHLLYARFWHKVLFDLGHVSTPEPFSRLFNQGYIQSYAFKDERGIYVDAFSVKTPDGRNFMDCIDEFKDSQGPYTFEGKPVVREYGKMGKSLKNAMAPDDICRDYGCDTLRLYEMSMGPLEASKPWNIRDIPGSYRFLQRFWRNLVDEQTGALRVSDQPAPMELRKALHKTIKGVRQDMEALQFNTSIAKLIELNNTLTKHTGGGSPAPVEIARAMTLMLAPLAPHMCEELWSKLGNAGSISKEPFPQFDEKLVVDDEVEMPVSVQGKVRSRITVPVGCDAKGIEAAALADEKVRASIEGKPIKKVIVVPGKMVNIVV